MLKKIFSLFVCLSLSPCVLASTTSVEDESPNPNEWTIITPTTLITHCGETRSFRQWGEYCSQSPDQHPMCSPFLWIVTNTAFKRATKPEEMDVWKKAFHEGEVYGPTNITDPRDIICFIANIRHEKKIPTDFLHAFKARYDAHIHSLNNIPLAD